jgi:hypothetical protein
VTLTTAQLPVHRHFFRSSTNAATQTDARAGSLAQFTSVDVVLPYRTMATAPIRWPTSLFLFVCFFMDQNMILDAGGAQPHENMSPYYVAETIMYCAEACSSDAGGTSCICDPLTGVCSVQATAPVTAPGPVTVQGKKRCGRDMQLTLE